MSENENEIKNGIADTKESYANGKAIASFIIGLIGMISWLIPIFSYASCIPGLIIGIQSKKESKSWQSTTGIILCIISLCLALANSILGVIMRVNLLI